MRRARLVVALLIVLSGCSSLPMTGHPPGTPDSDRHGWESGYWYDSDVAVTPGDGYNESERSAVVARQMARIERIRDLEFEQDVPVAVISREQYRANRSGGGGGNDTHASWNDQVWEGLFVIGESTGSGESFDDTLGASIQGYYSPGREEIVVVSDSATPTIDRGTLAHELVHALQDQHFGLDTAAETQDRQLAVDGVVEGEANYLQAIYENRCGNAWSCVPTPQSGSGDGGGGTPSGYNPGLLLTIYQPYATGPTFVDRFRDRGGWSAVSDLHENFPNSTEQVIHPALYPDEKPVNVSVPDRSGGEWNRFDHDPVADTVGEASVYAMFVSNDVVNPDDRFSYQSAPSAGWGGDALVPYTDGSDGAEGAYVWKTAWDTADDAREFLNAYRELLDSAGATERRAGVYVVPESSKFGDAFRVTRRGSTVLIVNAPTVDQLDDVHEPR